MDYGYGGTMSKSMRQIELCLLGDTCVGKSCLLRRFTRDRFDPYYIDMTMSAGLWSKTLTMQDQTIKFLIWDTAGVERVCKDQQLHARPANSPGLAGGLPYRKYVPVYYRRASAAIVVYDITCERSFKSMQQWVRELNEFGSKNFVIVIAANKCDKAVDREVQTETGREYAEGIGAIFLETSAVTGENVHEIFSEICSALPPEAERCPSQIMPRRNLYKEKPRQRSNCF
eukprot:gene18746-20635_t